METRLRLLIVLAGLPEPDVNLLVGDEVERRKYDLSYRRSKTVLEYDGRQHVERIEQWEADLERREGIDDDQWRILVFVAKDIYKSPGRTLERIHRALSLRGEPDVPATLAEAWRAHFPGWSRSSLRRNPAHARKQHPRPPPEQQLPRICGVVVELLGAPPLRWVT